MKQRIVRKKRGQQFGYGEGDSIRQQAYILGLSEIPIEFGDIIARYAVDLLKFKNLQEEKEYGHLL